jgi:hypothetical protein
MAHTNLNTSSFKPSNVLAIASLVCGILGGYKMSTFSLIAVVVGHLSLNKIKNNPDRYSGKVIAIAGLILGYFGLAITVAIISMKFILNEQLRGIDPQSLIDPVTPQEESIKVKKDYSYSKYLEEREKANSK